MSYASNKKKSRMAVKGVRGGVAQRRQFRNDVRASLRATELERYYTGWWYLFQVLRFLRAAWLTEKIYDVEPPRKGSALHINGRFWKYDFIRVNKKHIAKEMVKLLVEPPPPTETQQDHA